MKITGYANTLRDIANESNLNTPEKISLRKIAKELDKIQSAHDKKES